MKMLSFTDYVSESGFWIALNWLWIGKMAMASQFTDKTSSSIFCDVVSLVKFIYRSTFHVNIINGSGVMTIFLYKGLTRNPEIWNNPVNSWRLGQVRDSKFGTNVSNEILQNAAKCQGYNVSELLKENQRGVKFPPRLGLIILIKLIKY